ncbi:hypothetical protein LZZ85_12670 [Terrimonas sp. NA20]|uniref:Uncharacterized protein n=1 Tax=Terrimonas ginsenosidimutans TaxID=2908004 RepID=A0ABS9KS56_9BACT|nr:hypothetical protein [Terrimonas ginsenosidimutans]MCG2615145.1 hypothetical protein [Terrimonas ginsenosidimutans]
MHEDIDQQSTPATSETDKPVDIVQELIAIHTTRIDAARRLNPTLEDAADTPVVLQSTGWITQLTDELSDFGDAVQSIANRENQYQQAWKNALNILDGLSASECKSTWMKMEAILTEHYQHLLLKEESLPRSLLQMIRQQSREIANPSA